GLRQAGCGIHADALEKAAALQVLVQLGDQFAVIGGARSEGQHAAQQLILERVLAAEADVAETVALAALEDQLDVGMPGGRVHQDALRFEASGEVAETRGLAFDAALHRLVLAMVEASPRSEEHTSELQSRENLVCRLLLGK